MKDNAVWCSVGIGWTSEEFLLSSQSVRHPFDDNTVVSPLAAEVLWENAVLGPNAIEKLRQDTIDKYGIVKENLEAKEAEVHKKLDKNVEKVVANKSILLFKKMLEDTEYDDVDVHHLLMLGVKLIGQGTILPFWVKDNEKLPKITPEMLWAEAREAQNKECNRASGVGRSTS